jgi:outer membrane protein TolC
MKKKFIFIFMLFFSIKGKAQQDSLVIPESQELDLQFLIIEALQNNPEIQSAQLNWDLMKKKIPQANSLDNPELKLMQEEIPGLKFGEAMYSRVELMQMFPFPGKINLQTELTRIASEHGHHDHLEKINEVISKLKMAYVELWFSQQATVLNRENARLMKQFLSVAQTKFGVGETSLQDVLKAQIEIAKLDNELVSLRQKEQSAKAMLQSILNRKENDTLGFAVITEEIVFDVSLDTALSLTLRNRPMLKHDSLDIHEGNTMLAMAKKEFYPDFNIGLRYDHSSEKSFNGWTISAGITLPFAPWTIGKQDAKVEEAEISIDKANATLNATRNMIFSNIKDLYFKADASKKQLDAFRLNILPQLRQTLQASLTAYQNGKTDFLMLLDSYRMLVDMTMEYYMKRMEFEQTLAQLDKEVGFQNVATIKK